MARPISPEHTVPGAPPTGGAGSRSTAALLFHSLRPEQWTKNLIVFAGLIFGLELFDRTAVVRSLAAFADLLRALGRRLPRQRHHGPRGRSAAPAEGAAADRVGRAVAGPGRRRGRGARRRGARGRVRARRPVRRGGPVVRAAAVRLLRPAEAHRHPRRAGDCPRVRAARGGRGRRDRRADQPLAAGGDDPARAVPRAEQAAPRTGAARRRRHRAPADPRASTARTCSTR